MTTTDTLADFDQRAAAYVRALVILAQAGEEPWHPEDASFADALDAADAADAMLEALRQSVDRLRPGLVVLDNSAKLFAFSENDRALVTRGVRLLQEVCHDFETTLVLLAHVNKTGEFSGSTAWENAVRSRLSMTRDSEDKETILLARPKANYAGNGDVAIRWDRGSFRADDPALLSVVDRIDAENKRTAAEAALLDFIRSRNEQGRPLSHARNVHNFAPKVMATESGGFTTKEIEQAMERLFERGAVKANERVCQGPNRHWKVGIAIADGRSEEAA